MNQRTVNFNGVTVNPLHMSANPRHRVQRMFVSRTSGIFSISTVSSVIREAARIGSAAFFRALDPVFSAQRHAAVYLIKVQKKAPPNAIILCVGAFYVPGLLVQISVRQRISRR